MVNKKLIQERAEKYGNNFPMIAELWNNYFKTEMGTNLYLNQEDVAIMMGLMKVSRLTNTPSDEDTLNDLFNYMWIGENYEEYLEMIQDEDEQGNLNYTIHCDYGDSEETDECSDDEYYDDEYYDDEYYDDEYYNDSEKTDECSDDEYYDDQEICDYVDYQKNISNKDRAGTPDYSRIKINTNDLLNMLDKILNEE